jgi:hypothetical protein
MLTMRPDLKRLQKGICYFLQDRHNSMGFNMGERKRRFVLQPICDIDPTIKHPILGWDMQMLLDCLREDDQKVLEI